MSQKSRISLSHAAAIAGQAPLDLGDQVDLETLIEHSKRAEAERQKFGKLAAPAKAQAKHADLAANGKLSINERLRVIEQEVSIIRAKQKDNAKRKNAAVQYNGPTPERAAKATDGIETKTVIPGQGPVPPVRSHTISGPMDRYRDHIPAELEAAARDILHIFLLAEKTPKITSGYSGGASSASYGPRYGGVSDHVREANAMVSAMEAELPKGVIDDITWFIARVVLKPTGEEMKLSDSGRRISPWKPDPDKDTAVGYGAFFRTLEVLARFLGRQRALGWAGPASAADAKALMSEIRARVQVQRERTRCSKCGVKTKNCRCETMP